MLLRDMLGMSDEESDQGVYNCYVRVLESYKKTLQSTPDSDTLTHDDLELKCKKLEGKKQEVQSDSVISKGDFSDGNGLFYAALDRLNTGSDIQGCKRAASMLKEYLTNNPGSIMGETLLNVIREQFEE